MVLSHALANQEIQETIDILHRSLLEIQNESRSTNVPLNEGCGMHCSNNETESINAIRRGRIDAVKLLLDAEFDKRNNKGETALDIARKFNNHSIIEILEEYGQREQTGCRTIKQ